jgi:hypothetical protein
VVAERFEFTHFVKQRCALSQDRYSLINPDARKFIEEVWQASVKVVQTRGWPVEINYELKNVNTLIIFIVYNSWVAIPYSGDMTATPNKMIYINE